MVSLIDAGGTHGHATGESPFLLQMILFEEVNRLASSPTLYPHRQGQPGHSYHVHLMSGADNIADGESEAVYRTHTHHPNSVCKKSETLQSEQWM